LLDIAVEVGVAENVGDDRRRYNGRTIASAAGQA
jgi:hypothetical protein